jgi:hypothetical protein
MDHLCALQAAVQWLVLVGCWAAPSISSPQITTTTAYTLNCSHSHLTTPHPPTPGQQPGGGQQNVTRATIAAHAPVVGRFLDQSSDSHKPVSPITTLLPVCQDSSTLSPCPESRPVTAGLSPVLKRYFPVYFPPTTWATRNLPKLKGKMQKRAAGPGFCLL